VGNVNKHTKSQDNDALKKEMVPWSAKKAESIKGKKSESNNVTLDLVL